MSEKDPNAEIEAEFNRMHIALLRLGFTPGREQDVSIAAARMVEIAFQRGDPLMWSMIFARLDEYISRRTPPPWPLLDGVNEAFSKFRSGVKSLDEAFGVKRKGKGRPVRMVDREIARTRACVVADFIKAGDTLEIALERATAGGLGKALGGVSEAQTKRDYFKYRQGH